MVDRDRRRAGRDGLLPVRLDRLGQPRPGRRLLLRYSGSGVVGRPRHPAAGRASRPRTPHLLMADIPGWLLRHTVSIEPLLGEGSHGPTYGPAVTVRCFRDDKRKLNRGPKTSEVTSESTLYMRR